LTGEGWAALATGVHGSDMPPAKAETHLQLCHVGTNGRSVHLLSAVAIQGSHGFVELLV